MLITNCIHNALKSCPVPSSVGNITSDQRRLRNTSHDVTRKHFQDQKPPPLSPSVLHALTIFPLQPASSIRDSILQLCVFSVILSDTENGCLFNPLAETYAYTNILTSWSKMHKNNPCFSIKDNKMTISQTAPINNGDMVKTVV